MTLKLNKKYFSFGLTATLVTSLHGTNVWSNSVDLILPDAPPPVTRLNTFDSGSTPRVTRNVRLSREDRHDFFNNFTSLIWEYSTKRHRKKINKENTAFSEAVKNVRDESESYTLQIAKFELQLLNQIIRDPAHKVYSGVPHYFRVGRITLILRSFLPMAQALIDDPEVSTEFPIQLEDLNRGLQVGIRDLSSISGFFREVKPERSDLQADLRKLRTLLYQALYDLPNSLPNGESLSPPAQGLDRVPGILGSGDGNAIRPETSPARKKNRPNRKRKRNPEDSFLKVDWTPAR